MMHIDYTKVNSFKGPWTEEIALNFLKEEYKYVYNFFKITTDKNFILKALEKNKYLLSIVEVSSYFNNKELEKLIDTYFKNNDINYISGKDYYGDTILIKSIKNKNLRLSKLLIRNPFLDPNIQSEKLETALITACKYSDNEVVKLLIELPNIDITLTDENNRNALWYCLEFNIEILGYLSNKVEDMTESEKLQIIKVMKDKLSKWIEIASLLQKYKN